MQKRQADFNITEQKKNIATFFLKKEYCYNFF